MIDQTLLDRYEVKSLLGEGGMSSVYLAFDKLHSREVALKFIRKSKEPTPERIEKLKREFNILSLIDHKGVVKAFEFHDSSNPFYSMEIVQGIALDKKLSEIYSSQAIDFRYLTEQFLRLLFELAESLKHIHEKGIIYCDLKPSNIVLYSNNNLSALSDSSIKLIDFGIARLADDQNLSEMGTSLYNSPEQIRQEKLDFRSDIYSFGVTAFELITGTPPFNQPNAYTMAKSHIMQKVPDIRLKNTAVSGKIDQMIQICMDNQPLFPPPPVRSPALSTAFTGKAIS
jgi:serine/threonine-protein kinase